MIEQRFSELRERHWPQIFSVLEGVINQSSTGISPVGNMCFYHLETGGKRLRAVIPLLVAELLGFPAERMVPFGAACEMLHNATLVHDDLQDGDRVRRGRATVWAEYGAAQAINLGDAMFYFTLLCVQRLDVEIALREKISRRVLLDTMAVIDGQAMEFVLKEQKTVKIVDYLRMVEGKTSGLFALPMAGAAELAGADEETVTRLAEAARHLGVLFQIQDDVLDLYGSKGRDQVGNDIREGKRSILAVHLFENASKENADALRQILDTERELTTDHQVEAAIELFEEVGSRQWAMDELVRRRSAAISSVEHFPRLKEFVSGMCALFLEPVLGLDPRLAIL